MDRTRARSKLLGRSGISLFHVAGIEVRLDYTWFLIFALILVSLAAGYFPRAHPDLTTASYWIAAGVATLLFFASIVLHELSHALMARAAGLPVPTITLFLFGGVSELGKEPARPSIEFRVAVVGPLASFALAGGFWLLHAILAPVASPLTAGVARYLAWINAALGVFNLLPGLPLDGGRILRAVAWWRTGSLRRGTRIAANAGKGLAVGLMILGGLQIFSGVLIGGLWLVLIGLFLRGTAEAGYQNVVLLQTLEDVRVADVAIRRPLCVSPQLSLQALVDDYFLQHGYRGYPVVEGSSVLGLISIGALRGLSETERRNTSVKERLIPLSDALQVAPDLPLSNALKKLSAAPGGRLLVMRNGELVGLLTKEGLTRFVEIRRVLADLAPDAE
jgi:Zn-dependent protease/predicted transcriptional regulator